MNTILIIDDDRAVCLSIQLLLKKNGFKTMAIHHPGNMLDTIHQNAIDLVILDMNFTIDTSGKQGLKALRILREEFPKLPVILMTGWATVQLAVEGMKIGARDFIAKPWNNKQMVSSIRSILAIEDFQKHPKIKSKKTVEFDHLIGDNDEFLQVIDMAQRVSQTDASVLLLGESGTGKELVAEAIHYGSPRANQPFVKVNLGGLTASLFESELFGHKKGAFTDAIEDRVGRFEKANGGTIFLDEIGDLQLELQVKLLRVLQEQTFEVLGSSEMKTIDVRVISATNKPLNEMMMNGLFREDLFYRLNLITLRLPALTERRSDIPLLVDHFIRNMEQVYHRSFIAVEDSAMDWLSKQDYPGNIRQLKNLVERTVIISQKTQLTTMDFQRFYQKSAQKSGELQLPDVGVVSLDDLEKQMIMKTLDYHNSSVQEAAKSLGLTRSALYRRLKKFGIRV